MSSVSFYWKADHALTEKKKKVKSGFCSFQKVVKVKTNVILTRE